MANVNVFVTINSSECNRPAYGKYIDISFAEALSVLNDLMATYGDSIEYKVIDCDNDEVIDFVDLNRVRQPIYHVSDMIELAPYLSRFHKITTPSGTLLWEKETT